MTGVAVIIWVAIVGIYWYESRETHRELEERYPGKAPY